MSISSDFLFVITYNRFFSRNAALMILTSQSKIVPAHLILGDVNYEEARSTLGLITLADRRE